MKHPLLLIVAILFFSVHYNSFAQNVAVNTSGSAAHQSAMLDVSATNKGLLIPRMTSAQRVIIPSPATGLQVFDSDTKSFWFWNGTAWVQLSTGSATNFWASNGAYIFNNNAGNVGIGTSIPANKFTVQTPAGDYGFAHTDETVTVGSWIGDFTGASGGWLGTKSNHPLNFFTNGGTARMTIVPDGSIGIGTTTPHNKLQIGTTPGYFGFDLAIGNGTGNMSLHQNNNLSQWGSSTSISVFPGTGYFGINTAAPANKLQIGALGAANFNGNDLAIGNGTNAMVFAQTNATSQFASTTDFTFLPRYGTGGRVGINTGAPIAPLHVAGYEDLINRYYDYLNHGSSVQGIGRCNPCTPGISVYAARGILAQEFDAFSDARIKDVTGTSNAAQDLQTINSLQIRDYTMKDKVTYGNKSYKKVIAQEVEKVYPQVVSKHTDFVPNVYQVTIKILKTANGYLLRFKENHSISKEAKKLRMLSVAGEGMQVFDIVSIQSDKEVVISAAEIKSDKVFVYGEEVDDFRTVDYEGLTTLNISATQELSKLLQKQQAQIEAQNKKLEQLAKILNGLKETRIAVSEIKL